VYFRQVRKHGGRKTVEYATWCRIRLRAKGTEAKDRRYYSGVTVCKRWDRFEAFLEDMGPRPSGKTSIERKDNRRGYEPGNCVWADALEQNRNRSCTRMVTIGDETLPLYAWPAKLGIKRSTVSGRIRLGWSELDALLTPLGQSNPQPKSKAISSKIRVRVAFSTGVKYKGLVDKSLAEDLVKLLESKGIRKSR
jgi:hypothetical protein